ncbi:hypothetical protein FRC11_012682, partial [Ceratobasidium sp. 423]
MLTFVSCSTLSSQHHDPNFSLNLNFTSTPLLPHSFCALSTLIQVFLPKRIQTTTMADAVSNMIAEAIRRRKEIEEQEEQAQRQAEQQSRESSPPPADRIFDNAIDGTTDGGEPEGSQSSGTSSRPRPRPRHRSPSVDADAPEERGRKYARFTEGECDRFTLRGSRRKLVTSFAKADTHEKLITLMAFLQRHETEEANSGVRAYLASGAFKEHAVLLFHTALVAPDNNAYVSRLSAFIEDDMVRNHALYKIDKMIIEDEESRSILNTEMRKRLTSLRNSIKDKLQEAVEKNHCMDQVVSDIMPKQIDVTTKHRQRWAWVLAQYREYEAKSKTTSNFWKDLDKVLEAAELALRKQVADERDRDATRSQIYITALENHEKDYPKDVPPREKVDAPSWQIMLERNM